MTRVLVVDDEIDTLNLLRTILEISGYQAFTTLNSVEAITLAEVEHPDCILLDIMMPQLDGFTLCKMMRLHPATAHLPIVFVTAYSSLDLEERRLEAGADMVLPKPIGMDVLIEAVEKVTQMRKEMGIDAAAFIPPAPAPANVPAPIMPATQPPAPAAPAEPAKPAAAQPAAQPAPEPTTPAPSTAPAQAIPVTPPFIESVIDPTPVPAPASANVAGVTIEIVPEGAPSPVNAEPAIAPGDNSKSSGDKGKS
jgi:CheY-like chemotaxis protein